jgi:hypothetical protein
MLDAAHHLAARAVILGDAERVPRRLAIELQQARGDASATERVPGAGGMIVGDAAVKGDAGADRDLIADDQSGQKLAAVQPIGRDEPFGVGDGQQRRQDRDTGMALGQRVPVMRVEGIDRRGAGESRAGRAGATAIEDQARTAHTCPHLANSEAVDDARQGRLPPG